MRRSHRSAKAVLREIIKAKRQRRRALASLPLEEKLRLVLRMQKIAKEMATIGRTLRRRP